MTPKDWIALIGVAMQFVVLILAAGIYFGRQETKGTRKDDDDRTLVVRSTHPDLADLTDQVTHLASRLGRHEQECRDTAEANLHGVWAAINTLRQRGRENR